MTLQWRNKLLEISVYEGTGNCPILFSWHQVGTEA